MKSKSNPLITIVTVCFNAEKTIAKTIESVHSQSYQNIEHLIIDGQSTDETCALIKSYAGQISSFLSEPDTGIYNAMNKGIALANGKYILFLNADDYFVSATTIENLASQITLADEADIYFGNIVTYNHNTGSGSLWCVPKATAIQLCRSSLPHPATLYKKTIFEEFGSFDESYKIAADYDFYVKTFFQGASFMHVDVLVAVFSTNGLSSNKQNRRLIKEERRLILKKHVNLPRRIFLKICARLKKFSGI